MRARMASRGRRRHPRRRSPPSAAASTRARPSRCSASRSSSASTRTTCPACTCWSASAIIMVIGGLLSFKWPSVGGVIVCVAAMIGLIYTYDRGQYRWTPYLYYWWGSVAARLDLRHLRRLRGLPATCRRTTRSSTTRGTRRATRSDARSTLGDCRAPGPPAGGPGVSAFAGRGAVRRRQASSRIVTGPSLTSSTCMCAPKTPVSTGTPSARSASHVGLVDRLALLGRRRRR